jgi:hypothetical protein
LFFKFRPSSCLYDFTKHSPALSVLFCHITLHHFFFSVCSFYFLCLFCQCRTPLDSAMQHVSVEACYCCPMSVYIKRWNTVTPTDKRPKNLLLLYSMFLDSEALLADIFFFGNVCQFYLISGYYLTSSLQPSPHKPKYFEMCNSTYTISPYVARSGPLVLIGTSHSRTIFSSLHFITFMSALLCSLQPILQLQMP